MLLEIRRGRAQNRKRHVLSPVFVVGSGKQCDMVLGDPQFPEVHFYLLTRNGHVAIRACDQGPEVTINGDVQASKVLLDGDRIRTGPFEFVVRAA